MMFTYVPSRQRVILVKTLSAGIVAVASTPSAFAMAGGRERSRQAPSPYVDGSVFPVGDDDRAGNLVSMSSVRCSGCCCEARPADGHVLRAAAVPNLTSLLAASQDWFKDLQPVVVPAVRADRTVRGTQTGSDWRTSRRRSPCGSCRRYRLRRVMRSRSVVTVVRRWPVSLSEWRGRLHFTSLNPTKPAAASRPETSGRGCGTNIGRRDCAPIVWRWE